MLVIQSVLYTDGPNVVMTAPSEAFLGKIFLRLCVTDQELQKRVSKHVNVYLQRENA